MRSHKRYTTQTFTKRVDHEGGARHEGKAFPETVICKNCRSVCENDRWIEENEYLKSRPLKPMPSPKKIICPACKQIAEHISGGYLRLSGNFLDKHREDIENLLKNEEKRAVKDNPLSRIISWRNEGNALTLIELTTEHLAQRLGHALKKAFDGDVKYDFSHENKVARVTWHRD